MTKQKGFLLPLLLIVLVIISTVIFYKQKKIMRVQAKEKAVFVANKLTVIVNSIQTYQLNKAKIDQANGIFDNVMLEFPTSLMELKTLNSIPNCVETPPADQVATNCDSITKSPFGGVMKISTETSYKNKVDLNVDITELKLKGDASGYSVRSANDMTGSQKKAWLIAKQILALIPRSYIKVETNKKWLVIPVYAASKFIPTAPSGLLLLDGTVKLTKDWDIGNMVMIVGNDNLQLSDGTRLGTDDIVIGMGIRTVAIDMKDKTDKGLIFNDTQWMHIDLCQKVDGTKASSSNPYVLDDINVSAFISAIYPIVNLKKDGAWNSKLGRREPSTIELTPENAFANISTFAVTPDLKYQYSRYQVRFYLINYGRNVYSENGFWGDTSTTHNIAHDSYTPAGVGASKLPIGANISYIISCKRANTDA